MTTVKQKYKYAVIATDIVLFSVHDKKLKVLLIKMNKKPFDNTWAVPGGLVRAQESVGASAKRVLKEKTAVTNIFMEQLYTFGRVNRDPFGRVVSVAYLALVPSIVTKIKTTGEHKEVKWFNVDDLPELAYDHAEIIRTALNRLRAKLEYTNIVRYLLPNEFTMTEVQQIYELVLGRVIDKRNFRKKIFSLNIIKSTSKKQLGATNRPATLYRFTLKGVQTVEIL